VIKTLEAHFDGMVLHPIEPLALKPNIRVKITVESVSLAEPFGQEGSFLDTTHSVIDENIPSQQESAYATAMQNYLSRPPQPLRNSQDPYPSRDALYDRTKFC